MGFSECLSAWPGIFRGTGVVMGCRASDAWSLKSREASRELSGHGPGVCGMVSCKSRAKGTL